MTAVFPFLRHSFLMLPLLLSQSILLYCKIPFLPLDLSILFNVILCHVTSPPFLLNLSLFSWPLISQPLWHFGAITLFLVLLININEDSTDQSYQECNYYDPTISWIQDFSGYWSLKRSWDNKYSWNKMQNDASQYMRLFVITQIVLLHLPIISTFAHAMLSLEWQFYLCLKICYSSSKA